MIHDALLYAMPALIGVMFVVIIFALEDLSNEHS